MQYNLELLLSRWSSTIVSRCGIWLFSTSQIFCNIKSLLWGITSCFRGLDCSTSGLLLHSPVTSYLFQNPGWGFILLPFSESRMGFHLSISLSIWGFLFHNIIDDRISLRHLEETPMPSRRNANFFIQKIYCINFYIKKAIFFESSPEV